MNTVQTTAIIALSLTSALRIIIFDARGKTHKPLSAAIAYLSIVWFCSLALAAAFAIESLTTWLLIFGLALHTGAVLWSGGNVSKINPKKTRPIAANQGFLKRQAVSQSSKNLMQEGRTTSETHN